MNDENKIWKLKLRYGKLKTDFKHFTAIIKGIINEKSSSPPGNAFMGIKMWAINYDEAADIVDSVAEQVGFTITGKVEVFDTEPQEPPRQEPYGYDLKFTYFQA